MLPIVVKSSSARRSNVISNLLGAGWLAILQIVFVPIYVSRLGAEAYGHIGFHFTIVGVLRIFDLGLTPTMDRHLSSARCSLSGPPSTGELARRPPVRAPAEAARGWTR